MSRPTKQLKSLRRRFHAATERTQADRSAWTDVFLITNGAPALALSSGGSAGPGHDRVVLSHRSALISLVVAVGMAALGFCLLALVFGVTRAEAAVDPCPNAEFRVGPSAHLPDCRAYELVTPRTTHGQTPTAGPWEGPNSPVLDRFNTQPAAPSGASFRYGLLGPVEGTDAGGGRNEYRAVRGENGWHTELYSMTSEESRYGNANGSTPDHSWAFSRALPGSLFREGTGSLFFGTSNFGTTYLRAPDGSYELLGKGTLPANPDIDGLKNGTADDMTPVGRWISADGKHAIFESRGLTGNDLPAIQLLPDAPPTGVDAVYDRTPNGLKLLSLLPGEVTPTTHSWFRGSSADGTVALFLNNPSSSAASLGNLYARIDNEHTLEVAGSDGGTNPIVPAGVTDDNSTAFYLQDGNLVAVDLATGDHDLLVDSGDVKLTNISPDGSHVFFVSPSLLDGANGTAGEPNLYVRTADGIRFIATVRQDELRQGENVLASGYELWPEISQDGFIASLRSPTRTTADGSVLIFRTAAPVTAYDNAGHAEVYRYETASEQLECLSCRPDGAPGTADATLAQDRALAASLYSLAGNTIVNNLSDDGETVFFETAEPLVSRDGDGKMDVYRWRDGDVALVSSANSVDDETLMGATPDGETVFIRSTDQLVEHAQEVGVPGIYAARVNGGFAADTPQGCVGDECQDDPTPPPVTEDPGSANEQRGNVQVRSERCKRFESRAQRAERRIHKLKRKATKANTKKRRRALRKKTRRQRRSFRRLEARATACWKGSK